MKGLKHVFKTTIQAIDLNCGRCGSNFVGEIVVNCPMPVSIASMRTLRCPHCGGDSKKIFMGKKPTVERLK